MSKSLKQANIPQIITFLIVNVAALAVITVPWDTAIAFVSHGVGNKLELIGKAVAIPSVLSVLVGLVGWSLPRPWKETLIFWRLGATAIPSSQAFSNLASQDARINLSSLRRRLGGFPREPSKQTAVWYGIYRKHLGETSVQDAHGAYLRYREMIALPPILLIVSLLIIVWRGGRVSSLIICVSLLMAEYLVVMLAARNAATRLVTNVLAIESSAVNKPVEF